MDVRVCVCVSRASGESVDALPRVSGAREKKLLLLLRLGLHTHIQPLSCVAQRTRRWWWAGGVRRCPRSHLGFVRKCIAQENGISGYPSVHCRKNPLCHTHTYMAVCVCNVNSGGEPSTSTHAIFNLSLYKY